MVDSLMDGPYLEEVSNASCYLRDSRLTPIFSIISSSTVLQWDKFSQD